MAGIVSLQPKIRPRLSVEVCEMIIDKLAGPFDETRAMNREIRRSLNNCRLVSRDWVPRCRFHLFDEISVHSRASLQAVATFLRTSSFHADRVRILKIYGGGPDQSWISTVPFSLPKLRGLVSLYLVTVDFLQQPPHFYQVYSFLRTVTQSEHLFVYVDKDFLRTMPAKISTLAALLRVSQVGVIPNNFYPVHTPTEATLVLLWQQKLTRRTRFVTRSSLQELHQLLPAWTFPVGWWKIRMQTSVLESLAEFSQELQKVWEEISRIFSISIVVRPRDVCIAFYVEGLGTLELNSYAGSDPIKYGVWAELNNADDNALAYLSRILPYLTLCGLEYYDIRVKNRWSASTQSWHTLDEVLLQLCDGRAMSVLVMVDPTADVPSWEMLPYECEDDFCKVMLPRCTASNVFQSCRGSKHYPGEECRLHGPRRRQANTGPSTYRTEWMIAET